MTGRPPSGRRIWILASGTLSSPLLGPAIRYLEIAKDSAGTGAETHLVMDRCSLDLPAGIAFHSWSGFSFRSITAGDAVLLGTRIPLRPLFELLRSRLPFHADFYNVSAPESIEANRGMPEARLARGRARTELFYRMVVRRAERCYFSCPEQISFLGGAWYRHLPELAATFPAKSRMMPMGLTPSHPVSGDLANPYPEELHGRPIFLWGGGIWAWFDLDCLVDAFRLLHDRGSPAALFFLSGKRNFSGDPRQDIPLRRILARCGAMEGRTIFFNAVPAGPEILPAYLHHCRAGVLANRGNLEAVCSWRTRLLDLIASGRPLVASGTDPLTQRMSGAGAALSVPEGDSAALAERIARIAGDQDVWAGMCDASRAMASDWTWNKVLVPWREAYQAESSFTDPGVCPPSWEWMRYGAGI